jgi:hypothetical protein
MFGFFAHFMALGEAPALAKGELDSPYKSCMN